MSVSSVFYQPTINYANIEVKEVKRETKNEKYCSNRSSQQFSRRITLWSEAMVGIETILLKPNVLTKCYFN